MTKAYIVILFCFSILASACAYIIGLLEYSHHYRDKKIPRKMALQFAGIAFAVFIILGFLGAFVIETIK